MDTTEATTTPATKRAPRKTGKKAPVVKTATVKADGKIALKSICKDLKIEPKAARRKLRKADLSFHGKRERWSFAPGQATKVREILSA